MEQQWKQKVPWLLWCSDNFQVLQLVHLPWCYCRQVVTGLVHRRLRALPAWLDLCVPPHFLGLHIRDWCVGCVPPMLSGGSPYLMSPCALWHVSVIVSFLGGGTFLLSDTTKGISLILYIYCFSLWIGHLSKEHWFLRVENVNALHKLCRKGMTNNIFHLGLQVGRLPLKISVELCCPSTFVQDGDWWWEKV